MTKEFVGLTPKYVAESARHLGRLEKDTYSQFKEAQDFKQRVRLTEEAIGIRRRHSDIIGAYLEVIK